MTQQPEGSFARRLLDETGVTEDVRFRVEEAFGAA